MAEYYRPVSDSENGHTPREVIERWAADNTPADDHPFRGTIAAMVGAVETLLDLPFAQGGADEYAPVVYADGSMGMSAATAALAERFGHRTVSIGFSCQSWPTGVGSGTVICVPEWTVHVHGSDLDWYCDGFKGKTLGEAVKAALASLIQPRCDEHCVVPGCQGIR